MTVLIVDDEPSIADAVRIALAKEGISSVCCSNAHEALKQFEAVDPNFIILDIGLPDQNGFEVCRAIRKRSNVPILFLTARAEEVDRILGLELGGDDYMVKPFSPRELVARIRAILRRGPTPSTKPKTEAKYFTIDTERLRISFQGTPLDLSRYEFRLLAILVRRPGRVYSREELMNLAWETPEMSLERTVDTHIKTLRTKLRMIDKDDDSIVTHRGTGYSLREQE